MGVKLTIGDLDYEATSYSVSEASTPTAITDSSGETGTVNFTIKKPGPAGTPATPDSFPNPGWALTDGQVEARWNYAVNPSAAILSPEWDSSGGQIVSVGGHPAGITTALYNPFYSPGEYSFFEFPTGLTPGDTYTASIWVRARPGDEREGESVVIGTDIGAGFSEQVPNDGNWRRYHFTFVAPATTIYQLWYLLGVAEMTGVLVEEGDVLGPYFDGNTPARPTGERYEWAGDTFTSRSISRYDRPALVGWEPFFGTGPRLELRNGERFMRVTGLAFIDTPAAPTTVSILAVNPGQAIGFDVGPGLVTSVTPNEVLTVTGQGTLSLFTPANFPNTESLWGAPRFEVEGTAVLRQHPVNEYTEGWLKRQPFRLADTNYGFTVGEVVGTSYQQNSQDISITARSRTSDLNIFDVQAEPYIGTLAGAFAYYASLAGINASISVDTRIANKQVAVPGFHGEMWTRLKELATANECEIALVAGVIFLRPLRQQEIVRGRDFNRNRSIDDTQLAQSVEVYLYDSYELDGDLFYPTGGWTPEVEVLNVNAGETSEYTIEFDASISRFTTPVMVDFVSEDHDSSSVYTVVADDGLPVPPDQWEDAGGRVEFTLNEDTTSITVRMTGPKNFRVTGGEMSRTFSLALASARSGSRYSTLRIVGYGVGYHKSKHRFITGLPPQITATDVGVTIDNRFVNDYQTLNRVGVEAAKQYAGEVMSISGSVSTVVASGGAQPVPTYQDVKDDLGSRTNDEVKTYYSSELSLSSYRQVRGYWAGKLVDLFESQIFGRVQGARVWSKETRRWYRVRQASITPGNISFSNAEDDLTYADMVSVRDTMTYADVVGVVGIGNLSYAQERMAGAYNGGN